MALLGTCTTARDVDCAASLDAIRNIHVTPQEYFIPLTFELDPEIQTSSDSVERLWHEEHAVHVASGAFATGEETNNPQPLSLSAFYDVAPLSEREQPVPVWLQWAHHGDLCAGT